MSFFAILFALLIEQARPLSRINPIHAGVRAWAFSVRRNFDAGRQHHGWVAWGLTVVLPALVALVRPDAALQANPHEVADVFEVPLAFLLDPAHHRHHVVEWGGVRREWFSMPYQDGDKNRFIWGATAGMLRNFYRFMRA